MNASILIGLLALMSIGVVAVALAAHFGMFLRDPKSRAAAHNVFVRDGKSASTQAGEDAEGDTTLKQRLDASAASRHHGDPEFIKAYPATELGSRSIIRPASVSNTA